MSKKNKLEQVTLKDQSLPFELELESMVLGSVIMESTTMYEIGKDFSENLFYSEKNKIISKAIIDMYSKSVPIDIVSITVQLKKTGEIDKCGGAYYISSLLNKVGSTINISYWVKILQQKALERSMIFISNNSLLRILNYKEDVFEVFSNAQQQMDDALKSVVNLESKQLKDIHFEVLQRNINIVEHGLKSGVPTGLRMLDNVTGGWQNTDLIILAGRPSMGKTATAVSMCIYPSLQQNIPVAIFSLEMSSFQLVCRIQSYLSEISVDKIIKGNLTMDEIRHIDNACEHIPKAPLYIDDTPNISLLELKSKCRKLVRENSVKMIVIDYLQLMRSGFDIKNREQEIAEISRGLKSLAKELNVPIIALSQLSRLVESRTDKKPLLSDLRESGQIEQDADMVIFTYRPQYYGIEQYEVGNQTIQTDSLMMLIVSKHRNGELGEMPMMFLGQFTKVIGHSMFEKNNVTFVPQQEPLKPNVDFLNTNYEEAEDPF